MTKRISITLPTALVEEIDRIAGPRNRSELVAVAVERYLLHERQRRAIRETAGVLKDYDFPDWETPEKASAWIRRSRDADNTRPEEKIARWNTEK